MTRKSRTRTPKFKLNLPSLKKRLRKKNPKPQVMTFPRRKSNGKKRSKSNR